MSFHIVSNSWVVTNKVLLKILNIKKSPVNMINIVLSGSCLDQNQEDV